MFRVAFIGVSVGMLISLTYLQLKLIATVFRIRENNKHLKNLWSDFGMIKRLKKIAQTTDDENTKKLIADYLKNRKIQLAILVGGFLLLMLIGFSNAALNKNQ